MSAEKLSGMESTGPIMDSTALEQSSEAELCCCVPGRLPCDKHHGPICSTPADHAPLLLPSLASEPYKLRGWGTAQEGPPAAFCRPVSLM